MNNKEFLAGLSQKWGTTVSDTRKRVDNIVRVLGECFDDGMPVAVEALGVFVVIKYKESIVVDNKKRRMLVPPRMELNLLKREQLLDVAAVDEKALSERLVGILGDSPEECRAIVESFFHALTTAVDAELMVKVKGLGTFKAISTKESKHIDTETGEMVTQTLCDEVSYTPDKAMRDVVNRPFAQFKPIELNEGVVFEDMEKEDEPVMLLGNNKMATVGEEDADEASEDVAPVENAEPVEESATAADAPESTDVSADDETSSPDVGSSQEGCGLAPEIQLPEENGEQETEHQETPATAQLMSQPDAEEKKTSRKWLWWMIPAAAVLVALLLLLPRGGGEKTEDLADIPSVAADSVQEKPALDFEAMNKRSPYGAYDIVGVDTTIVVRPGQSLSFICRVYIGPDMESYIQILNGIEDIHEGDTIMIPTLQLRSQYQKNQ